MLISKANATLSQVEECDFIRSYKVFVIFLVNDYC